MGARVERQTPPTAKAARIIDRIDESIRTALTGMLGCVRHQRQSLCLAIDRGRLLAGVIVCKTSWGSSPDQGNTKCPMDASHTSCLVA